MASLRPWTGPAKFASNEEVQALKEQVFALDKKMMSELLVQRDTLRRFEMRMESFEKRLDTDPMSTPIVDAAHTQHMEDRLQELERQFKLDDLPRAAEHKKVPKELEHSVDTPAAGNDNKVESPADVMSLVREMSQRQDLHHVKLQEVGDRHDKQLGDLSRQVNTVTSQHLPEVLGKASEAERRNETLANDLIGNFKKLEELEKESAQMKKTVQIIRQRSVGEAGEEHDVYHFKESVWDASVLQWISSASHKGDMTVTFVLYLLNGSLQLIMTYLIYSNLSVHEWISESVIADAVRWRIGVSHSVQFYHEPSNTSLATRVCRFDGANVVGHLQADTFGAVETYTYNNFPFNGPMLCICAMIVWTLLILREVKEIADFVLAIYSLRITSRTSSGIWDGMGEDTSFKITQLSIQCRICMLFFIALPRVVIAVWLGFAGVMYLSQSSEMGDLILNCIALGFVLDLDELIFTFSPKRVAWVVSVSEPIPTTKQMFSVLGLKVDLSRACSSLTLLLLVPCMIFAWAFTLRPLLKNLTIIHEVMCGGVTNVVVTQDQSNNIMSYAATAEEAWLGTADHMRDYEHQGSAILQTIGLVNIPELEGVFDESVLPREELSHRVPLPYVMELHKQSRVEAIEVQKCLNVDYDGPARAALQASIGMEECNMTLGYDAWGRCNEPDVRRFCPKACYCHKVSWWNNRSGCPHSCSELYAADLNRYVLDQQLIHGGCSDTEQHLSIPYTDGNITFFSRFLQEELLQHGHLDEHGYPSPVVSTRVNWLSTGECSMRNTTFDLEVIVREATRISACNVMRFVDLVFGISLCSYKDRFTRGLGNIAAFCPSLCNMCSGQGADDEPPGFKEVVIDTRSRMRHYLEPNLKCGYEWIYCGDTLTGNTGSADGRLTSYLGSTPAEKIYAFWGQRDTLYTFRVTPISSSPKKNLKFTVAIYDSKLSEPHLHQKVPSLFRRLFGRRSKDTVLKDIEFQKEAKYHLVVEPKGGGADSYGSFKVQMSTENVSECRPPAPQQIRCEDVLNTSILTKFSTSIYPQAMFKFQAEPGVEYRFESCSSKFHTNVVLYDDFSSIPPLSRGTLSSHSCEMGDESSWKPRNGKPLKHQVLTARFDSPGKYHVVVERGIAGWFGIADIQIRMHCTP